ncbi:Lipopolysaccharide export system ATP-binding protein LptB [Anaerococcus octavius]|uniref:Lipopolysaccharide export system ATP-binding protein LptB n=1 Tax=Anaerococcus octavius TaxID=54007 RepID=A0A380WUV1_9FIRM|nr:ABC transporter ATP-binding protein [Anaerococcus octavius]SUU92745.1 Lipopolysaccharide export system ATP-binding protein LptB [Anaerococcus octavius]
MELEIRNVNKKFKDKIAVNNASATLTPGVWGLLGANGAGKTTLIKMITGISTPSQGEILYNGKSIDELGEGYRNLLGFLPQEFICAPEFTVYSFLQYVAALKDMDKSETIKMIDKTLEILNLSDVKYKKVVKLSGGMRRRVGISQAILNDPKILILDEPTAGLDPGERIKLRNFITEISKNKIVLLSTHIVSDIEHISTSNLIMKEGKFVHSGTTDELVSKIENMVYEVSMTTREYEEKESNLNIVNVKHQDDGNVLIRYISNDENILENSKLTKANLEDFYLWTFPEDRSFKVN